MSIHISRRKPEKKIESILYEQFDKSTLYSGVSSSANSIDDYDNITKDVCTKFSSSLAMFFLWIHVCDQAVEKNPDIYINCEWIVTGLKLTLN